MRHIRKTGTPFEEEGVKATQEYIDSNWIEDEGRYRNLSYSKSRMKGLEKVLYDEQKDGKGNSYCCYCMKRLFSENTQDNHKENITLEHIVPHKIKESEWERDKRHYLEFPNLRSDKITICYNGELSSEQVAERIGGAPFPHYVSYHNLVLSCDGRIYEGDKLKTSCCCNNKRGDNFVMPIYLSQELCDNVSYDSEGQFVYEAEGWIGQDFLALNSCWLTQVRKTWRQVAKSEYTAEDVEHARTDTELRQNIIDDIDADNSIAAWENDEDIWNLFSEYMWFYDYYKDEA